MSNKEVKYGSNRDLTLFCLYIFERHLPLVDLTGVKFIKCTLECSIFTINKGQRRVKHLSGLLFLYHGIPLTLTLMPLWITETHTSIDYPCLVVLCIPHGKLPVRVISLGILLHITCPEKTSALIPVLCLTEFNKVWKVSVLFHIINEIRHLTVNIELLRYDMIDSHPECTVRSCLNRNPEVCILGYLCIIRRTDYHFSAADTEFGDIVTISSPGPVRRSTGNNNITCVIPVSALTDICLLTPNLRMGIWQVCVVVIETQTYTTHKLMISCT